MNQEYLKTQRQRIKAWSSKINRHNKKKKSSFVFPSFIVPIFIDDTFSDSTAATTTNDSFHTELSDYLYQLEKIDTKGKQKCISEEYPNSNSYTTYLSDESFVKEHIYGSELIQSLIDRIEESIYRYADQIGYVFMGTGLEVDIWGTIIRTNGGHPQHVHEDSLFSGTYYVGMKDDTSVIEFLDPLGYTRTKMSEQVDRDSPYYCGDIVMSPHVGEIIMFPSYMPHKVTTNITPYDRISFSFNVSVSNNNEEK